LSLRTDKRMAIPCLYYTHYTVLALVSELSGSLEEGCKAIFEIGRKVGERLRPFIKDLSPEGVWEALFFRSPTRVVRKGEGWLLEDMECPLCEGMELEEGSTYCHFLAGVLAGALGREVEEVECKAGGGKACRFFIH